MNINATLIGQSISFFLFVWFCMKFVWPPLMAALDERKKSIADGLAAAERGRQEHELAERHAKDVIREAKDEASNIIAQAQRRASEIVDESKNDAKAAFTDWMNDPADNMLTRIEASRNLTNLTLELGGKDPMIVCRDADVERAARGAVWGAFCNCGQSCGSIERAYVHTDIAGEFTERVTALTQEMKVGDPLTADTDLGPMTPLSQICSVLKSA